MTLSLTSLRLSFHPCETGGNIVSPPSLMQSVQREEAVIIIVLQVKRLIRRGYSPPAREVGFGFEAAAPPGIRTRETPRASSTSLSHL